MTRKKALDEAAGTPGVPAVTQAGGNGQITLAQLHSAIDALARFRADLALETLTEDDLKQVVKQNAAKQVVDELDRKVKVKKTDYVSVRERWINHSPTNSAATIQSHRISLKLLEDWCAAQNIDVLDVGNSEADAFAIYLRSKAGKAGKGLGDLTVNLHLSAVSSFFNLMNRYNDSVKNPFRGCTERPPHKAKKEIHAPTLDEVERMIKATKDSVLKAAIAVMAYAGLRVGALPSMTVSGDRLYCSTKGKKFDKLLPERARSEIKKARLPIGHPFEGWKSFTIQNKVQWLVKQMCGRKPPRLREEFSCHDFRHCHAMHLWEHGNDQGEHAHDIYFVQRSLGHTDMSVTQRYLRGLKYEV